MKTHMKRRTERKQTFRPWLETLESRWCPAVSMSVEGGHALVLMGDRGDNVIDIAYQGSLTSVTGDGVTQTFTGIDTIRVNTWAGRDTVRLVIETPPPDPDFSFTADLGAGDDSFTLVIPADVTMPPPSDVINPCIKVAVQGGAGDDLFQTFIGQRDAPLSAPRPHLGLDVALDYQGGAGNDSFFTDVANVALDGPVTMFMNGGQGDDTFSSHFTNVDALLPAVQRMDGGEGNDTIENTYTGMVLDAPLALTQNGGDGNDTLTTSLPAVQVNAPLAITQDGGDGADQLHFSCAWQVNAGASTVVNLIGGRGPDEVTGTPDNHIAAGASSEYNLDGGAGDDHINFSYDNAHVDGTLDVNTFGGDGADDIAIRVGQGTVIGATGHVAIQAMGGDGNDTLTSVFLPAVQSGGSFTAKVDGGAGQDTLTGILLPAVQRDGSFTAMFDGGAGQDTLIGILLPAVQFGGTIDVAFLGGAGNDFISMQVDMTGFTPESGRLRVAVDGGEGSDQLIFLVRGAEMPMENAVFTLDGGFGEDFALVSAMVQVKNCEHVEIV